jgi:hypothetical protein
MQTDGKCFPYVGGKPKGGGPKQHGASCVWWSDGSTLGTLC